MTDMRTKKLLKAYSKPMKYMKKKKYMKMKKVKY